MTGWEDAARASYDRVAEPYAQATQGATTDDPYMAGVFGTLAALARALARPPTVVDAGCGPGWWAGFLADAGADVTGVDLSEEMVALARRNAPAARFVAGSVLDLPVPDAAAHAVACWYVLHHLPDADVDRALGELARVLRPGGVLLLGGHVGDARGVKTSGYGGHPMEVLVNKRPASFWAERVGDLGLAVEAHTLLDPGAASASHALFARKGC